MNIPDFGRTTLDYARFRAGFPRSFFSRIRKWGIGLPSQRILDLGTGTGTIPRGLSGSGSFVIGLDIAINQLNQAKLLSEQAGGRSEFLASKAESAPFQRGTFDVILAGQCWHWFDRKQAAVEAARLLVADGLLVIAHFDWIPLPGNVPQATEALILEFNPEWKMASGNGLYPQWLKDLGECGYRQVETFSYDEPALYSHQGWRGRVRASAGVGASLPPDQVDQFDFALKRMLADRFPTEPLEIQHRIFAVIARAPSK